MRGASIKTLVKRMTKHNLCPFNAYRGFHLYSGKKNIGLWNPSSDNDIKEQAITNNISARPK
jgi:hypothetical protein